ncbi:4-vinyl reductase, 4VR domain protein [mine drainage metagenome]|uniref:4-vinyl reductase, 4VR domain protein n=1 Tax=mine drainage metagenome TaxID=410659 RepID=T1AB28_9ZZZZ
MLVKDMMQGNGDVVSSQVFALTGALASLTPKLREVYFSHGFKVGNMLHRYAKSIGSGAVTPMPILMGFFNRAGYVDVAYRPRGNSYGFEIHDTPHMKLGAHIHMFEAGIISGFMSAEYRRVMMFTESACRCDTAGACMFVEGNGANTGSERMDSDVWMEGMSKYILEAVDGSKEKWMNYEYYGLASDSLLHREYASSINDISYMAGNALGRRLKEDHEGISVAVRAERLKKLIALLNFGNITIKRSAPLSVRMEFSRLVTKKDVVALASNFMSGMLNAYLGRRLIETQRSSLGRYIIDIKEAAQGGTKKKRARRK